MPDLEDKMETNIKCMLASLRSEEDISRVLEAGVTEACFVGAEHYWHAFEYIRERVRAGKKPSKTFLKRKFGLDLPLHTDDPKLLRLYADEVVLATAVAQADDCLADMLDEISAAKSAVPTKDTTAAFYESIRKARNLLRDVACPSNGASAVLNGQSVEYTLKGSMVKPPPQRWLVKGLVPDDVRTFLYGRGGSAKSYLAVYLALCVATGTPFVDVPSAKGKVLYIDWEAGEETFRARVNRVANTLDIDLDNGIPNIRYKRLYAPLNEHLDDIIEECAEHDIALVIIDSFGFSMSGQDTSAQPDVTSQMARLAKIPGATVIIDHIGKQGKGEDGPFGSVYKHAAARWMWWLRAVSEEASPDGEVKPGTFVRMANTKHNIARKQKDIYLQMIWDDDFDADKLSIKKVDRSVVPESLAGTTKEERGESALSPGQEDFMRHARSIYIETHEAAMQDEMVIRMGVGIHQVRNTAESLHKLGLISIVDVKVKREHGDKKRSPRAYLITGHKQLDTDDERARV